MEPNALHDIEDANTQVMTGIVPSESTFSGLRFSSVQPVTSCRMPNPYLGEDYVEVMRWFLQKVCSGQLPKVSGIVLSAYSTC